MGLTSVAHSTSVYGYYEPKLLLILALINTLVA